MRKNFKRKTGFTLIELLAVILILGIIALIAIPTVTNIIKESKKGAFKASIQNLISAAETQCQLEQMRGEELITSYSFTNGQVDNELNVKGNLPKSGTITVDSDCNVSVEVTDGTFTAKKSFDSDEVQILDVKMPKSFAEDDWNTIVTAVKSGNLSVYKVGDTKEIALTGFTNEEEGSNGLYTIRIANTSTPEECNAEGFSQTACGFVIEFEDIITRHAINATATNVGGWEASDMRTYVNDTIYNAFPSELKGSIIDTMAVSSHGETSGEVNFVTIDKIYLLSNKEVFDGDGQDTAKDQTRQLDYYAGKGVTSSNYLSAIKNFKGSANYWWHRSAWSLSDTSFYSVSNLGPIGIETSTSNNGVAPAFRIN